MDIEREESAKKRSADHISNHEEMDEQEDEVAEQNDDNDEETDSQRD
jgi:hypothetical protein